jgi:outer membrane autotransporter protein
MFAFGMRFTRVSVSGALLVLGTSPGLANAASCDSITCLTTPQANLRIDGTWLNVGTGGELSDSTVSNGRINLLDAASASGTRVFDEGWLMALDNSQAFNSTVASGGTMVVAGSATALTTHVNGGNFEVAENAVVSDTLLAAGTMYVYADAAAKNTWVENSEMTVYEDAFARQTSVSDGGLMSVLGAATATDTTVNKGGRMDIGAGTNVHSTTVNRNGLMTMQDRAVADDTTLNIGGALHLKGDAILGGETRNDGHVSFADPAINGFHTLTIKGPLTGTGQFMMNTDLAALRGDRINLLSEYSGAHTLVVADSGNAPSGPFQKLMLVDGNGGNGTFSLYGGTVDAGAYRYQLQQQGNDWYLANLRKADEGKPELPVDPETPVTPVTPVDPVTPVVPVTPVEPVTPVDPVTPVAPVNPEKPIAPELPAVPEEPATPGFPVPPVETVKPALPQAETLSKGANAAVGNQAAGAALISAQMSATTGHFGDLRSGKDRGGLWTRGYAAEQRLDTGTGRAFDQQINSMEIGADKALSLANGTLYVGALVGQGQGRQDFGEASKGSIDSTTLGAYASYLDRSGLYLDGALKYSRLNNDIDITSNLGEPVKAHFRNYAVSADVQVGKHIDLGRGWFVEPQAGVQVARISGGDYTASNGLQVQQDSMTSVQSRVGGAFGRDVQLDNGIAVRPYAKAAWVTEHAGSSHVKVNGAKLRSKLPGSRADIGGGISVAMAEQHSFFAEGGYSKGSEIEQPWAATVGYRYSW